MRIAVSGATGLVGSALSASLVAAGVDVQPMVRASSDRSGSGIPWDPAAGRLDPADLAGLDAIVHLAGESIAGGAWTKAKKRRIRESRTRGTRLIAESIAACDDPPSTLISASAVGWYGDRGDDWLAESSRPGEGFLADVCQAWEAAADPARAAGTRVAHPRIGLVLSTDGGLLERLLLPFRLGLGGRLGDGRQWMSWVVLDDLVAILRHLIASSVEGPVNAVAPTPVTNRDFTRSLAAALKRPALLPVPSFALRLLPGDMGEEMLLASARVRPQVLEESGFSWRHRTLETALEGLLGSSDAR